MSWAHAYSECPDIVCARPHPSTRREEVSTSARGAFSVLAGRLLAGGFLKEVIRGWYIPSRPDEAPGDSTAWYASFWDFCAAYLAQRFGTEWCLSPEQSLSLHGGNRTVPAQPAQLPPLPRQHDRRRPHLIGYP